MTKLLLSALFLTQAAGWADLFDGKTMKGWTSVGTVQWTVADNSLTANPSAQPTVTGPEGKPVAPSGFLRTDASYANFDLTAEFWSEPNTNSGMFIRCVPGQVPSQTACYEVNISDSHATFPTGQRRRHALHAAHAGRYSRQMEHSRNKRARSAHHYQGRWKDDARRQGRQVCDRAHRVAGRRSQRTGTDSIQKYSNPGVVNVFDTETSVVNLCRRAADSLQPCPESASRTAASPGTGCRR
jgi:Domain of Unknown Function (DUF1080)